MGALEAARRARTAAVRNIVNAAEIGVRRRWMKRRVGGLWWKTGQSCDGGGWDGQSRNNRSLRFLFSQFGASRSRQSEAGINQLQLDIIEFSKTTTSSLSCRHTLLSLS